MRNKVVILDGFTRSAKKLAKRYRSFGNDLTKLIDELKINPLLGIPLGGNLRKIRLSIKSKGKGKSGGARIITYLILVENTVFLLAVYDKAEIDDIPVSELVSLLKAAMNEIKR